MSNLRTHSSDFEAKVSAQIGFAATVMASHPARLGYQFAVVPLWLRTPILLNQIQFWFNDRGGPFGYLSWAKVSKLTLSKVISDDQYIMHKSEWCDGEIVLLLDVCINENKFFSVSNDLIHHAFQQNNIVVSIGRKGKNKNSLIFWKGDKKDFENAI